MTTYAMLRRQFVNILLVPGTVKESAALLQLKICNNAEVADPVAIKWVFVYGHQLEAGGRANISTAREWINV